MDAARNRSSDDRSDEIAALLFRRAVREKKRNDFFVHQLPGIEPPERNQPLTTGRGPLANGLLNPVLDK